MMTLAIVFSFLDRGILALLVEPIKADLGISDTQMSLLLGFAFASFYAVMGIPFGIMVDRVNRVGLMSVGFLLWTIATAASGLTRSFGTLFPMRMAVGIGEATAGPAAPSVIADSVPKERLATAMSIYAMGVYLGAGLATVIGGAVAGIAAGQGDIALPLVGLVKPWQFAFILVGLAGLLPLLLIVTTVREPERKGAMADRAPKFAEVAAHYRRHRRAIGLHHVAFTALAFSSYGVGSWLPSFFVRTFGWSIGKAGLWLGINAAVTASVSVMIGGWLADRWYRQGKKDAKMRVPLLGSLLWLVPGFGFLLAPSGTISIVLLAVATLGSPRHRLHRGVAPGADAESHARAGGRHLRGGLELDRARARPDRRRAAHRLRVRRREQAALLAADRRLRLPPRHFGRAVALAQAVSRERERDRAGGGGSMRAPLGASCSPRASSSRAQPRPPAISTTPAATTSSAAASG